MTKSEHEKQVQKHIDILKVSREEAEKMVAEDERIDRLTMKELKAEIGEEKWKIMQELGQNGTRKTEKKPTNYNFAKKTRKKDDEKEDFIEKLAEMLQEIAENVEIVNKNREISLKIGENDYSLTLVKHSKKA